MENRVSQIIKSDKVELEGQYHIDAVQAQIKQSQKQNPALTTPQVRILENNPEYAVIDITCSCGTEMSVRCDYAEAQASEP